MLTTFTQRYCTPGVNNIVNTISFVADVLYCEINNSFVLLFVIFMPCPTLGRPVSFPQLSRPILLPRYLRHGLSNFDNTDGEYSLAHTDNVLTFWRPKVKGQAHMGPKYVVAKTSSSTLGRRSPYFLFCLLLHTWKQV